MPVKVNLPTAAQMLTGDGADNPWIAEINVTEQRIKNSTGLLNGIINQVVLPALRRNWDNCNFKMHRENSKGRSAVSVRNAQGNIVRIMGDSALITYDPQIVPYIGILIDGRRAVGPVNAKALAFNKQYGKPTAFRKYSGPTMGKAIYYLTNADSEAIEQYVQKWIGEEQSTVEASE